MFCYNFYILFLGLIVFLFLELIVIEFLDFIFVVFLFFGFKLWEIICIFLFGYEVGD